MNLVPYRFPSVQQLKHLKQVQRLAQALKLAGQQRQRRRLDRAVDSPEARILRQYRPAYWTGGGNVTYRLVRIVVNKRGKVHGHYEGRYFHYSEGRFVTSRAVYGVQNNVPFEISRD